MKASRFDRLTSRLARRQLSRRTALKSGGAGVLGLSGLALQAVVSSKVAAQEATPITDDGHPSFLFVQLFDQGTWLPKPDEEGVYLLSLAGSGAQTLYFSDRPERIVGTVPTSHFLNALGFTPFNPPNAALVVRTPEGERDVLVVELFNPVFTQEFDADGGVQVTYEARLQQAYEGEGLTEWVREQDDWELPAQFNDVSLFIDDCPDLIDCTRPATLNDESGLLFVTVGFVPGPKVGRCWSWSEFNCVPCINSVQYYNDLCNQAYPAGCFSGGAANLCNVSCWAGVCP